jgi:hypothetical protein
MKVQHGIVYSDSSGKFGGGVATKGRYGAVVRTKVKPKQPASNYAAVVRANFTAVSAAWRTVTAANVAAWNAVAKTTKLSDIMGRSYSPSGFQMFASFNMNLLAIGKTIILTAPTLTAVPTLTSASLTAVVAGGVVTLTYAPAVPANVTYKCFATPSIPVGKVVKASDFRQIGTVVTADASPLALTSEYAAKYPNPMVSGQVVYVRLVPVIWTPGQAGIPFQVSATVVAA